MLLDDDRVSNGRETTAPSPTKAPDSKPAPVKDTPTAAPQSQEERGAGFTVIPSKEIHGTQEFRRDRSGNFLVMLFGGLTLFLVFGLWFGNFSKQESMRGHVSAASGSTRVAARYPGIVSKIWVNQGDMVTKGQKMITIRPEEAVTDGARPLETRLAGLISQRENLVRDMDRVNALIKAESGDRSVMNSDSEKLVKTLRLQEIELEKALAAQEISLKKIQGFHDRGYATREQLTSETRVTLDYRRQLSEIRFKIAELNTTLIDRRRSLDQTSVSTTNNKSELQNRIHEVDAAIQNLRMEGSLDIVAPADGIVSTMAAREGMAISERQFVVALAAPDAPIRIFLEAPAKSIGLLTVGKRVVLKYDAFPFKTFGVQYGTVISVSDTPLDMPSKLDTSSGMANPLRPPQSTFLVEVQPEKTHIDAYGEQRPILIGSTLTADVVVERRRLIDWVLDPVLAMRGRT